jgi:hypothetical protein
LDFTGPAETPVKAASERLLLRQKYVRDMLKRREELSEGRVPVIDSFPPEADEVTYREIFN